jgi:hypothetical protein
MAHTKSSDIPIDKTRHGLPSDWSPTPEQIKNYAECVGLSERVVLDELVRFRFYYTEGKRSDKSTTARGWKQAFFNWLTNAKKFAASRPMVISGKGRVSFANTGYIDGLVIK